MNNENSSKQVLLSIIGIAILVVAVVGVSFAFFSYSKTGQYSNVVTTGNIFFNFTEGEAITLENQFPVEDSVGEAFKKTEGAKDVLTFDVVGWDTSKKGIDYTIYAVKGDIPSRPLEDEGEPYTEGDRLADQDVKLKLTVLDADSTTVTNDYATPKTVKEGLSGASLGTTVAEGSKIATGKIPGQTKEDSKKTVKFELRMWISEDTVLLVGKDQLETEKAKPENSTKSVYTTDDYNEGKFYSLKVLIDAKTSTTTD